MYFNIFFVTPVEFFTTDFSDVFPVMCCRDFSQPSLSFLVERYISQHLNNKTSGFIYHLAFLFFGISRGHFEVCT